MRASGCETCLRSPETLYNASVMIAAENATPNTAGVRKMVETARTLNPRIEVILRTHTDEEAALFRGENLGTVFMGEHELARAMTRQALSLMGVSVEERSSAAGAR